ncbi:small ribosomal subunit protein mS47 [Diutina catenulata]
MSRSLRFIRTVTMSATEPLVLFKTQNNARIIELNRPKKLNSLNTEMVDLMLPELVKQAQSDVAGVTILTSTMPKRALCAGGDVAACAEAINEGGSNGPSVGAEFFYKEYSLNLCIASLPQPYVSIMDGITMGGGCGLSLHAPFRVVTEKSKVAMPEMDIGFFPDVGTTFFLPRLDDKIGFYYALTGSVMSGTDAYLAGFATHFVAQEQIPALINRLSNLQPPKINGKATAGMDVIYDNREYFAQVNQVLDEFAVNQLPEGTKFPFTDDEIRTINAAFSQPSIETTFEYLNKQGTPFASKLLDTMKKKPTSSLKFARELLKRGQKNSIKSQLEQELVAATNIMALPAQGNDGLKNDFALGVTHKLIKKIKEPFFPEWTAASKITDEFVQKIMSPSLATSKYLTKTSLDSYFNIDYKQYPFHMGLPSNQMIAEYITGNDGSNRSYLPTPKEVVSHFQKKTNNKAGVDLKVQAALAVHGDSSKYDGKYVSWRN